MSYLLPALCLCLGSCFARGCPAACGQCPPPGFDGACCHGNVTCETTNWTPKTCTPAYGTWCARKSPSPAPKPAPPPQPAPKHHPSPSPKPPSPAPTPSPSPAPSRAVPYAGINLAGFDYGTLARAGSIWCTDEDCSSGGWSDPRVPEQDNCPGYGGNKAPTYQPSKICNGLSDVPGHYNGGFGAPRDFRVENFGHGGSAISEAVPTYARASPLLDEVEGAQSFGMNVFRLPFRIEYVHELWQDTWLVNGTAGYLPPYPHYLQMVVDFMESALAAGEHTRAIIFDLHNYFRWCPLGIGGTFSCLEGTGYEGPIRYDDTDASRSSCPLSKLFPNHAAFENVCPKHQTPEQQLHYWDSPVPAKNFSGIDDYDMAKWTCPLDAPSSPPSKSRWATCGWNRAGPPTDTDAENPYAKVLSGQCFTRIWHKLLSTSVGSKAFPGQCQPLHKVLNHYSAEGTSSGAVFINLMNEPNMVDTDDLARAYKDVITMMRGAPFNLKNRLLVEGNYWAGLHAQITPKDRSGSGCGAPSSAQNGHTTSLDSGRTPLQIIHEAVASVPNAQPWTIDVHQYFDYDSTGNWDCGHGWPNNTCAEGTVDQVKDFVNWEAFSAYISEHDISVAVTEFGGHPTERCARWLRSFLTLLEDNAYQKGKGGVLLWTAWRTCPHTSWYLGINPHDPSADCLQFSPPVTGIDPPTYSALWSTTSDPKKTNLKKVLKDFM